jgi:transcriptional regulator with XRE-family HTH domain
MMAFGDAVMAWRLARGLTQEALARAARVPRPNLSAIERGGRDVTLRTLRALALALDVKPGVLADGIPPQTRAPLGREGMERIARAASRGTATRAPAEAALAGQLRAAMSARRGRAAGGRARARPAGDRAYFRLRTQVDSRTLASLVDRVGVDLERPGPRR